MTAALGCTDADGAHAAMTAPNRNIELKARCGNLRAAAEAAASVGAVRLGTLEQTDTYFRAPTGRLKLRETTGRPPELIWYDRADCPELRDSDYYVVPVSDAARMKAALGHAMGVRCVVRKRREPWMHHNVRIHLDDVEDLGTFIEFEAVITCADDELASLARLEELTSALTIAPEDRISNSYSDLLFEIEETLAQPQ
jgi:adenylate cyclase class IV